MIAACRKRLTLGGPAWTGLTDPRDLRKKSPRGPEGALESVYTPAAAEIVFRSIRAGDALFAAGEGFAEVTWA